MIRAFLTGLNDGLDQPIELSMGMTYSSKYRQFIWDIASHIGQLIGRIKS